MEKLKKQSLLSNSSSSSNSLLSDWQLFNISHKNVIKPQILNIIQEGFKFNQITKVQNSVIPYFIQNKDVIVKVIVNICTN